MSRNSDAWEPSVSFRLPQQDLERVRSIRPLIGGVEEATTSAAMRQLVSLALAVFDSEQARVVADYARRENISRQSAWQRVVDIGIDGLIQSRNEDE